MTLSKQISQLEMNSKKISLTPILVAQQLVLLPLYFYIPVWITVLNITMASFVLWSELRFEQYGKKLVRLPVWLKVAITLVVTLGVVLTFRKLAGRDAGVALIAIMYGLKLLETSSRRDVYVLMILGFFLLLAGFLFNQSPLIALYQLVPIAAILNALMLTHSIKKTRGLFSHSFGLISKRLLKYLVLAIPLMVVLFVFFPRLSGPIWKMPGGSSGGSGISDTMSPGAISSLRLFDKVAFRVKFNGNEPIGNQLYWRTLVLDNFDGLTWSRDSRFSRLLTVDEATNKQSDTSTGIDLNTGLNTGQNGSGNVQSTFEYEISLEKTNLQWLTMLDRPIKIPSISVLYEDYSVQVEYRVMDRIRYKAVSQPQLILNPKISDSARAHNTAIPRMGNPRSVEWARQQRKLFADDRGFVISILSRINRKAYFYTLSPPIMDEDTVDSFWFDEQRGFCEHYAAALVFLSRAAGIPARVVVGYQGAEKNPLSDYWIVRYANAHAWTEIWLENEGWVRFDPTAAIASHRIEEQLQLDYRQRASFFDDFGFDAVDLDDIGWTKQVQYWMDKANSGWNDWILDYDSHKQRKLFANLGLERLSVTQISLLMVSILSLFLILISFRWMRRRKKKEPIQSAFALLLTKLEANGLRFAANVGAKDILKSVSTMSACELPENAIQTTSTQAIIRLLKRYIFLRYSQKSISAGQQKDFLKQVRQLKIRAV